LHHPPPAPLPYTTLFRSAFVKADASSAVDLGTGHGPVKGTIQLLTDIDPNRNSLDTLLVTGEIDIRGDLDLTTASVTATAPITGDRKSTRLNSSHVEISY